MAVDYFVTFWVKIEDYKTINIPLDISKNTNSSEYAEAVTAAPFAFDAVTWERNLFLYIYGGLIVSLFIFALLRSMLFYKLAMISSQKLHDSIFFSVINASMRFFDTNPGGRILNRFSKDIGSVDEMLPKAILDAAQVNINILLNFFLLVLCSYYF